MLRSVTFCFVLLFLSTTAAAQQVTISNNLLYDAWLTPNLRVGTRLAPHWSVGLTGGYRPWPTSDETTRKWRHLLLSPDVRYWTDSVNVHHFFGANLIYSHYNVSDVKFPFGLYKSVRDERRQGDLGALGLFYGYSWPLGRHWNIEAAIGAAVGYTSFTSYACGHCGKKTGNGKKAFAMPQAAVNIVYNIPGRQRRVEKESVAVIEPVSIEEQAFVPVLSTVADLTKPGQLRKDERPLNVHFPLDRSELLTDFRNNAAILKQIVEITHHILTDTSINVKSIQIVGLASIEGPIKRNEQLGHERAMALQRYVQQELSLPDSLFGAVGGGEAWDDFRAQLEECAAADSQHADEMRQALAVIDSESDLNERERKLRRMNSGRTWAYIKEHILSDQRCSGYIRVFYATEFDHAAKAINRAVDLLRTDCSDCHQEALHILYNVREDQRAQNALGVALYLCGRRGEALDCLRQAAANGDADAKRNLQQIEQQIKH